ncbi:hypothetical protein D3C73_1039060 [compost metagenome]
MPLDIIVAYILLALENERRGNALIGQRVVTVACREDAKLTICVEDVEAGGAIEDSTGQFMAARDRGSDRKAFHLLDHHEINSAQQRPERASGGRLVLHVKGHNGLLDINARLELNLLCKKLGLRLGLGGQEHLKRLSGNAAGKHRILRVLRQGLRRLLREQYYDLEVGLMLNVQATKCIRLRGLNPGFQRCRGDRFHRPVFCLGLGYIENSRVGVCSGVASYRLAMQRECDRTEGGKCQGADGCLRAQMDHGCSFAWRIK